MTTCVVFFLLVPAKARLPQAHQLFQRRANLWSQQGQALDLDVDGVIAKPGSTPVPRLSVVKPIWLEPTRGESRGLTSHPGLHILNVRRQILAV